MRSLKICTINTYHTKTHEMTWFLPRKELESDTWIKGKKTRYG